jgi:hypothetical protein
VIYGACSGIDFNHLTALQTASVSRCTSSVDTYSYDVGLAEGYAKRLLLCTLLFAHPRRSIGECRMGFAIP